MTMFSMTGFGRSQSEENGLDLNIEVSSVNRRNLEVSISLPREWQPLEREVQALVRKSANRGKVNVMIQAKLMTTGEGFQWDPAGLESSLQRLEAVAKEHGIAWPPDADALVRLAAQNKVDSVLPPVEEVSAFLMSGIEKALSGFMDMRAKEGEALMVDLRTRSDSLREQLAGIQELSKGTVARYQEVLLQRLRQLGLELDLNDERVLKEVAIFADRCDTSEEQTRLDSHLQQFSECLDEGSPIGRKLEFILQEMNREFNTIGSKANNIEANRLVIEAKNEIERIREQIQNIE